MSEHTGRTYLIVAATSGIGSALAHSLVASGARVALAARNTTLLEALGTQLGAPTFSYDALIFSSVEAAVNGALESFGHLDGAACLSGSLLLKPAHMTGEAEWATTIGANATAAFGFLRATTRAMKSTGGSLVLVSSAAARIGLPNHEAIAAAKAAVEGMALSAAATYAKDGIRVNCVAPGLTRTPLTASLTRSEAQLKGSIAMHPLGRVGEANDVAAAIAWLLSAETTWVTGQVVGVDGGLATLKARPAG